MRKLREHATKVPRTFAGAVSACQIATLLEIKPRPMPATMRPAISWPTEKLEAWRREPMAMASVPKCARVRRPNLPPATAVTSDPKKHPSSNSEVTTPWRVESRWKVDSKSGAVSRPPMTPLSYPDIKKLISNGVQAQQMHPFAAGESISSIDGAKYRKV